MTRSTEHRLTGFEHDNFLAFLALLGLLRSLETARPEWGPRVRWDRASLPTRPILVLANAQTPAVVAECAAAGCAALAADHDFGQWRVPTMPPVEARRLLTDSVMRGPDRRHQADLFAAIMCDAVVKRDGAAVVPTPLCLMFGQGHQYFLERLRSVPALAAPRVRARGATAYTAAQTMARALFQHWERSDRTDGFRWDPAEDRRYALRFLKPSDDEALTEHGANRLAAVGMPVLTLTPTVHRGRVRGQTLGVRQARLMIQVRWPLWTPPASLSAIRALLTHPALYDAEEARSLAQLRALGVHGVRAAQRVSAGKFMNFTRAEAIF